MQTCLKPLLLSSPKVVVMVVARIIEVVVSSPWALGATAVSAKHDVCTCKLHQENSQKT